MGRTSGPFRFNRERERAPAPIPSHPEPSSQPPKGHASGLGGNRHGRGLAQPGARGSALPRKRPDAADPRTPGGAWPRRNSLPPNRRVARPGGWETVEGAMDRPGARSPIARQRDAIAKLQRRSPRAMQIEDRGPVAAHPAPVDRRRQGETPHGGSTEPAQQAEQSAVRRSRRRNQASTMAAEIADRRRSSPAVCRAIHEGGRYRYLLQR